MKPTGSGLLYADQAAAEEAASAYRQFIVETVDTLGLLAVQIDSFKLATLVDALKAKTEDINF